MNWRYRITLQWRSNPPWCKEEKVIDHADDVGHARYLVALYQSIYGSTWRVRYERQV
jgi:hypothetical protein